MAHRRKSRSSGPAWPRAAAAALACGAALAPPAAAHEAITTELTWTRNVSRIVFSRCAGCHRGGGAAPMPLTTYAEVRPWAAAIKHEVLTRRMPPWGAVKGFGAFRNDASLSAPEIAVLSSWAEGGAPEGDPIFFEPYHRHEPTAMPDGGGHRRLRVRGALRLEDALVATGVSPAPGPVGSWLQVTAHLPGGGVEHLLWLRRSGAPAPADYWFLRPIEMPAGTRVVCHPPTASAELRFAPDSGP